MAEKASLKFTSKPSNYQKPSFLEVQAIADTLRRGRQPVIDKMWARKRARRGQWEEVVRHIPSSYRKLLLPPDLPQINDMINRIAGLISKEQPECQVMPPNGRDHDVRAAAKEEACLNAMRIQIADQQDRDPYAMAIDAQISLGESWIGVFPDPRRFKDEDYTRKPDEEAGEYSERYKQTMADCGIPVRMIDFDPHTVLPMRTDDERLSLVVVESDHQGINIELGLGYKPIRKDDGSVSEWVDVGTLSEPYVGSHIRDGETSGVVDTMHDRGRTDNGVPVIDRPVRKTLYMDCWTQQTYLDGMLVEEWEHDYGIVPMFPAGGEQSSDRDPAWQNQSIIDPALAIARQVVLFSAILASNAMRHGFPTPMLKNPVHGLVGPDGTPLSRAIRLGEMNFLGPNEELTFPFLDAGMMPDFFKHMEYLSSTLEASTLSNFGQALGSDMAGYAIAQIRAQQMSVLGPVYKNAEKQWRKIYYFCRFLTRREFPAGIYLRGAIEETDDGKQYRPIMEYSEKLTTHYAIEAHIDEGIKQDEIAANKNAIEMKDAGIWSPRRAMEKSGVEDPQAEIEEIKMFRLTNSPAYDQAVSTLAQDINTQRAQMVRNQTENTPFRQALDNAKKTFMGGGGQFQNQESTPANANPDGQPTQQNPPVKEPQQGGPTAGAGDLSQFGVPEMPGGVEQANLQSPAMVS